MSDPSQPADGATATRLPPRGDLADQAQEMAGVVLGFVQHASRAAERTIGHMRWVLVANLTAAVWLIGYFIIFRGWWWAATGLVVLAVSAVPVWVGHLILHRIATLPQRIGGLVTEVTVASRDLWPQIQAIQAQRWRATTRWRSYLLLGKILWRVRQLHGGSQEVLATVGAAALTASPLFWAVLFGSIVLCAAVSVLVVLACLVHLGLTIAM